MENRLIVPFCCKRLMGYCCHPTGWVGGQRGHHEVSDCNNLRMQTWDLYIYTKGAFTRWMRGSTGSCQYFLLLWQSQTKSPHACKDNGCAGIVVVCKRVIVIKSEV